MTDPRPTNMRGGPSGALALPLAAFGAAMLTALAYWPGLMTWDSVNQYGQALDNAIDDWHPPTMQWIWRQAIAIQPGPGPMLLLQLLLYWGGLTLLAGAFWSRGRKGLACALLACGLLPSGLALTGMILKDSLMAGALLVATGLLAMRQYRGGAASAVIAAAALVFAATLRFNAFTAGLPLVVALLPRSWSSHCPRRLLTGALVTLALMAAMPIANRIIGARPSGVELSLVIFDLGGITEHSRADMFPKQMDVPNAVAINHRCYRPDKWDSYSDWVDPECPLGYSAWNDNVDRRAHTPYFFWARAILLHPIAYAEHRLIHFAYNTRILPLADAIERPVPSTEAPNRWGFDVMPNRIRSAIDALALAVAHTPLGWPIVWIGLALGALIASRGLAGARLVAPIALSSLLYGCGYLVFSVASELRYHLWTEIAALIVTVLVLSDREIRLQSRRLVWAFAPALSAALLGIILRMTAA